jgi:hypothetical protein
MPSLDELEAGTARLSATYQNITVTFTYYPARVGMNLQRAIASVTRPPYDMGPIADELSKVLEGWDLTRHGELIPISAEGLGGLPMGISSAIGREIMEDFHDPKSPIPTGGSIAPSPSSPPISRDPDSATARPGPTSSYEQNGQASIPPTLAGSLIPVAPTSGSPGSAPS